MVLFFYAFIYGTGIGLSYFAPLMCSWEFFPSKKGTISGIIVGTFGFSAFFFGFITLAIVNPDNEDVDKDTGMYSQDIADRVPLMLRVMCLCFAIFATIGIIFIRRNPVFVAEERKNIEDLRRIPEEDKRKMEA